MLKFFKKYLWLIGIALFVYVALRVDWQGVFAAFEKANFSLLSLSFILIFAMLALKTLRWKIFTDILGVKTRFADLFSMTSKSVFWGIITPAKLGEFSRAKYLAEEQKIGLVDSIWSVFMHKFLDVVDTCLFGVLSVFILASFFEKKISYLLAIIFLAIVVLASIFFELIKRNKVKKIFHLTVHFLTPRSLRERVDNFVDEMLRLTNQVSWKSLGYSFLLEIGQIIILGLVEILIALALGIKVPFWFILAAIPFIDFLDAMPISVLGLGVREASYVALFGFLSISNEASLAFSLLVGLWSLLNALPGFFIYLFANRDRVAETGSRSGGLLVGQRRQKVMLSFDLEFWYETDWLKPYLPSDYQANDYLKEQVELILDLLDKYKAKATFFTTGSVSQKYPHVIKEIAQKGHEIASHGFSHKEIFKLGPEKFEQELGESKQILEQITGKEVKGFRACRFSLSEATKWALPLLKRYGFKYDSSCFPMKTGSYGISSFPNKIYSIDFGNIFRENKESGITEIPLTIVNFWGLKIPVAGGVYFRCLPLGILKFLIKKAQTQRQVILYFHPHELYSKTPQIKKGPYLKRVLKYWGQRKSIKKFEKLLQSFQFDSIKNILNI